MRLYNKPKSGGILITKLKRKNIQSKDKLFTSLHNAVHFCFNEIAKQNKWSSKDVNQALNEYFNDTVNTKKKE
jgi:hypothetical protein